MSRHIRLPMHVVLSWALPLTVLVNVCLSESNRCLPGDSCFPANLELIKFMETLDGKLHFPHTAEYDRLVIQRDTIYTKFPFAIVEARNTADVQRSVIFARKHNLLVSVKTSGHDFIGRSTAHGSLQIYLGSMNATQINLSSTRNFAGEITCESGNTWSKVYEEVDRYNRVIVGGSGHTVSVAGYTLGGGHSPMSRMFGLAVDNLLEVKMVTANGHIVVANDRMTQKIFVNGSVSTTDNTDIFWASRGGGGGTYGIATEFSFKLHLAAPQVVQFLCSYPIRRFDGQNIGFTVLKKMLSILTILPKEWGGYLLISGVPDQTGNFGRIMLALNHHGILTSTSRAYLDQMKNFHREWQSFCFYKNFSSFYQYDKTAQETPYFSSYSTNTLLQNDSFTDDLISFILQKVENEYSNTSHLGMTGTLLGGRIMTVGAHDTSVNPAFRSSSMSLTTSTSWTNSVLDYSSLIARGNEIGKHLNKFGTGQYVNNAGDDVMGWQHEFWGSNYMRLLTIKETWDPDNFFTCKECVGSENNSRSPYSTGGQYHVPIGPLFGK